ncbi:terpene cyclase/mutase family protein [Evansella halocellulosilytica]|uniref:terpene cyclase/mutase family protein n=1 Tax=Evansella halocellulosilytica TaxID=2011013 RepID=UPI000BB78206|nr:prenyltransferase/squalene oxidase repeat-containing protein [Evansella halocellulosilytica]
MKKLIEPEVNRLIQRLQELQAEDGSWKFCFESSPTTDAYMIILLRSLNMKNEEELIIELVKRMINRQLENGAWKIYEDENEGNLSLTIEAYYALLYSGYKQKHDPEMKKAEHFIHTHGGISKALSLTKMVLTVTGPLPWPKRFPIPIEFLLLPQASPLNFFDFSGYARVHIAPMLVIADQKFVLKRNDTPNLSHLMSDRKTNDFFDEFQSEEARSFISFLRQSIERLIGSPNELHQMALKKAERFMLNRIERDGTLYSYFTTTFLMIYALLSLGYSTRSPVIQNAVNGLKSLTCRTNSGHHLQHTTSTIWNTALISDSLQSAGVPFHSSMIQKANDYLIKRQHTRYGDWVIHNPLALPGGWGFSNINTINPDVDDTTAALRSLRRTVEQIPSYREYWYRGINWVLSMQNDDGGWPAFEKNTDKRILTFVPIFGAKDASIDPSSADLTGRTLHFLGRYARLFKQHHQVNRGVRWLLNNQERDGSWYGRWGICYIYGTWAAITGMTATGVRSDHASIQKAVHWLMSIQNDDGGWGESCKSDIKKTFIALGEGTLSQTAWAVDALISVYEQPTDSINRGIYHLIGKLYDNDWTYTYPTGGGLPGYFYFYYYSYNYIWPLLALSHYVNKYNNIR